MIADKLQYTSVASALSRIISCLFLKTSDESDTYFKQSDAVVNALGLLWFPNLLQRLYYWTPHQSQFIWARVMYGEVSCGGREWEKPQWPQCKMQDAEKSSSYLQESTCSLKITVQVRADPREPAQKGVSQRKLPLSWVISFLHSMHFVRLEHLLTQVRRFLNEIIMR